MVIFLVCVVSGCIGSFIVLIIALVLSLAL